MNESDPLKKRAGVVYLLPCTECESSYIVETKRPLETRLREHKAAIKRGEVQMSAASQNRVKVHFTRSNGTTYFEGVLEG